MGAAAPAPRRLRLRRGRRRGRGRDRAKPRRLRATRLSAPRPGRRHQARSGHHRPWRAARHAGADRAHGHGRALVAEGGARGGAGRPRGGDGLHAEHSLELLDRGGGGRRPGAALVPALRLAEPRPGPVVRRARASRRLPGPRPHRRRADPLDPRARRAKRLHHPAPGHRVERHRHPASAGLDPPGPPRSSPHAGQPGRRGRSAPTS